MKKKYLLSATVVVAALFTLAGCSSAVLEEGSGPEPTGEAETQEIRVLLDKEDQIIGTLCGAMRDLHALWIESEDLRFGKALIQKTSITGFSRSIEGLVNAATEADPSLLEKDLADIGAAPRNKSGEISAADLYFYAKSAQKVVEAAKASEEFSPEKVPTAELDNLRDVCRAFPNAIKLEDNNQTSN